MTGGTKIDHDDCEDMVMLQPWVFAGLTALRQAADSLISMSVAPSSRRCYDAAVKRFKEFCLAYHIKDKYIFSPQYIEAYVTHLSQKGINVSSIQSTLSALRHYCRSNSIDITFDTDRLSLLLRGIRQTQTPNCRPTNAVKLSHLTRIILSAAAMFDQRLSLLLKAMFSLAFYGLLRPSEMCLSQASPNHRLLRSDVILKQNSLRVKFRSYKHSLRPVEIKVQRQGQQITCPWLHMNNYLCSVSIQGSDPLFNCSVSEASSWLHACLTHSKINTLLGLHSFRRGGATWYSSHGMSDPCLKALGRWTSDAYLSYVKPK